MSAEKIKLIYLKNKGNKGADTFTPMVVILIVASIFSQLYTNVQRQLLQTNIDERKCNPRFIFFSGFLNPFERDPITTTHTNFQKCVARNVYKDQTLLRDINKNNYYIKKNKMNIESTMDSGRSSVRDIREKWSKALASKQDDLNEIKRQKDLLFENQGTMYDDIATTSSKLFHVLKSILVYIENIIQIQVSDHKKELNIETLHNKIISLYEANHRKYMSSYDALKTYNWTRAINDARDAIQVYEDMTEEIDVYMKKNAYIVSSITENCYQLKYNMDNDSCSTVFPNLNKEMVAHYPLLKTIL